METGAEANGCCPRWDRNDFAVTCICAFPTGALVVRYILTGRLAKPWRSALP